MKWLLLLIIIVAVVVWVAKNPQFYNAPSTTNSHRGAADLFMKATLAGSETEMQKYCTGDAPKSCHHILSRIKTANPTFASYQLEVGGVPAGNRTSGRAMCFGSKGDLFMTIDYTLENKNGEWKVCEVGATEAK